MVVINCPKKIAKIFNILTSLGISTADTNKDFVQLAGYNYVITWIDNYIDVPNFYSTTICYPSKGIYPNGWANTDNTVYANWLVIDEKGCYNKYKDSQFAINTTKYSVEEVITIITTIIDNKKLNNRKIDFNVPDSFSISVKNKPIKDKKSNKIKKHLDKNTFRGVYRKRLKMIPYGWVNYRNEYKYIKGVGECLIPVVIKSRSRKKYFTDE
jgi:hypothetical protein